MPRKLQVLTEREKEGKRDEEGENYVKKLASYFIIKFL